MSEPVLVTGITGFTAKHIALNLLEKGYHVRGSLRTPKRANQIRQTLQTNGADISGLSFTEANLDADAGWTEAASGCAYVLHVASPFPLEQPRDREALVPQARQGALRVLGAARAAEVKRIVALGENAYVTEMTGVEFRPAEDAVRASGQSLIDHSVV
ncbi:MAG: NAD-dependent epimerase/dehydratase family protein [Anaerolineaceae bacterium]|nr:MAG: NAD-dependent epimerase/dehydratase family protein [Anaerolineaceae bacterium]